MAPGQLWTRLLCWAVVFLGVGRLLPFSRGHARVTGVTMTTLDVKIGIWRHARGHANGRRQSEQVQNADQRCAEKTLGAICLLSRSGPCPAAS